MDVTALLEMLRSILVSPQMGLLLGLIIIDLGLGVALAVKWKMFEWGKLADFYRTSVIPYLIGYVTLALTIKLLIPKDAFGITWLSDSAVTLAWSTLILSLAASAGSKLKELYPNMMGNKFRDTPVVVPLFIAAALLFLLNPLTARAEAPAADDTFPSDDVYCLAAATHVEAASQSEATKTAVAQWIIRRAIERHQTICGLLLSDGAIRAAHTPEGTWPWYVFHNGDLMHRQRGVESWLIAMEVYDWMRPLVFDEQVPHFDSCDSRADWTAYYTRVQLDLNDSVCFWE